MMMVDGRYLIATNVRYVVKIQDVVIRFEWTGSVRWNEEFGCEEFLMLEDNGREFVIPAFCLQDAHEEVI